MVSNQPPWNNTYKSDQKIWGEKPSELAIMAFNYLRESQAFRNRKDIFILDLGCGYGRDAIFLAQNLPCHILGLDNSEAAIEMARRSLEGDLEKRIELLCYDFSQVTDKYDVILVSNLYHLLKPDDRRQLRETVKRCLGGDGICFLSTLSVRDPQHFGKGTPVEGESNSFVDVRYLHLSTRHELETDFDFLKISALYERQFHEPRTTHDHDHVSWIMMGRLKE
jgi:cyclopropane fatty-acyl-phospholipid synthase-like methyltransferase